MLKSTSRMFELALGQLLWGRRALFMMLAAAAPIVLALAVRFAMTGASAVLIVNGRRLDTEAVLGTAMSVLYFRFIVPAVGVFYGTSLIADEIEEKTITYLFLRPMTRGVIVLGKYLAYLVCVNAVVLPSAALVFFVLAPATGIGSMFDSLVQNLGRLAVGLAAYGALFTLVGVSLRRPLVGGLIFAFAWEQVALVLPGYLRRLTIAHYLQEGTVGLVILVGVSLVAIAVAMWTIGHREYVLQQ